MHTILGDSRINQNPQLALQNVIMLREHNRIARALAKINPRWNDEKLFQTARTIAIGMFQHICFTELIPVYIEESKLYIENIIFKNEGFIDDYDRRIDPAPLAEFSQGAFRQGHSLVAGPLE